MFIYANELDEEHKLNHFITQTILQGRNIGTLGCSGFLRHMIQTNTHYFSIYGGEPPQAVNQFLC